MQLLKRKEDWFIDGHLWPEYFARAICPVEYQKLKAAEFRKKNLTSIAEAYEGSAKADEACEIKWNARVDGNIICGAN